MKAIVIHEAGGSEKLLYEERPIPDIKSGWSLVKVKGFGINRSELFTREGKSPSVAFPRILGIECAGIIEKTSDSTRFSLGQKVVSIMGEMGRAFDGSYAEYVLLPNEQIYKIDSDLPWATLAAIPETYYTAYQSMRNLCIQETDSVLVRGATSGVGVAFAQLVRAKFPSIELYGSSRSLEKVQKLKNIGFTGCIQDRAGTLDTNQTFHKILELIGPITIKNSFEHIEERGIICNTGQLGGQWFLKEFDPITEIKKNSYFTSFYSGNISEEKMTELLNYIEEFQIQPNIEKIFTLKETANAHDYLEAKASFGKVIVLNEK